MKRCGCRHLRAGFGVDHTTTWTKMVNWVCDVPVRNPKIVGVQVSSLVRLEVVFLLVVGIPSLIEETLP